jgi:hypothetical protein
MKARSQYRNASLSKAATMNRTTICKQSGCGKSVTNADYCDLHVHDNAATQYDAQRRESPHRKLYDTAAWKRVRAWKLGKYPMCEHKGCSRPATVVHHKIDHCGNWFLFIGGIEGENLESLCKPHHDEETMTRNIAAGKMSR